MLIIEPTDRYEFFEYSKFISPIVFCRRDICPDNGTKNKIIFHTHNKRYNIKQTCAILSFAFRRTESQQLFGRSTASK